MSPLVALVFRAPHRFWLVVPVVGLGFVHLADATRRRRYAVRFTNLALLDAVAPRRPRWRRHLPAALLLLAGCGLVAALALPARQHRVPRGRATIIVAMDASISMLATDVAPSRIEAARKAAERFVAELPPRFAVGLVTFYETARLAVPPTLDREEVYAGIDQVHLGEGTAMGDAIYASLDAIELAPRTDAEASGGPAVVPARIVLLSDGNNLDGRPVAQATRDARRAGVPVSTIAFGTRDGVIPGLYDQPRPVPLKTETLARIAADTGGTAFTAANATQLRRVYAEIGSSVGTVTLLEDLTGPFVAGSLAALLVAALLSQLWFSRLP